MEVSGEKELHPDKSAVTTKSFWFDHLVATHCVSTLSNLNVTPLMDSSHRDVLLCGKHGDFGTHEWQVPCDKSLSEDCVNLLIQHHCLPWLHEYMLGIYSAKSAWVAVAKVRVLLGMFWEHVSTFLFFGGGPSLLC